MKDKTFCCSFTGHRPAKLPFIDEKTAGCVALKNRLFKEIKDMVYSGISTFYSGMAQGVDIWCAEIVLALRCIYPDLGICLHALVPYQGQEKCWDDEWKARYYDVLTHADSTKVLRDIYVNGCLYESDRLLVDLSDYIIGVYCNIHGGTKYTLDYAKKRDKNIIIIDPSLL